jgi:hypothetical protein
MTLATRTHILLAGLLWSALLFAAPPHANAGAILAAPTYVGLGSGLVGYWSFNSSDLAVNSSNAVTAYDRSGNKNHSDPSTGATAPPRRLGKLGQALDFNGNNSHINVTPTTGLHNMAAVSASFWLYSRDTPDTAELIIKAFSESQSDGWNLIDCGCGTNNIAFKVGYEGASDLVATTNAAPLALNCWQHIAVTWDGSSNASGVTIYVDGASTPLTLNSNGAGARTDDSANDLVIGNDNNQSAAWDGLIDEVRLYDRPLTADEIKRLYKVGATAKLGAPNSSGSLSSGLVGWWTFDGKDIARNTTYDRSGQNTTGILTSGTARTIGKIGQALTFNGSSGDVNLASAAALDLQPPLSVSLWFKTPAPAAQQTMFGVGTNCCAATEYELGVDDSFGTPFAYFHFQRIGGVNTQVTSDFTPNQWNHVVGVYDGVRNV